jgi:hypothetical protein
MKTPSLTAGYLIAVVGSIVSLALTQSLITDQTAQLVTGLASILIPGLLSLGHAIFHAHTTAAKIATGQPH